MKILAELTGGADICRRVDDLEALQARAFLREGERVLFALASAKDEFVWTGEALVVLGGDSAASTKRLVERFDFQSERVAHVVFESCGLADRDCEIKFHLGARSFSIDIARQEAAVAQRLYRAMNELRVTQESNFRGWEFARQALEVAVRSTATTAAGGNGGGLLLEQADAVQSWLHAAFTRTNPACYAAVLERALQHEAASTS